MSKAIDGNDRRVLAGLRQAARTLGLPDAVMRRIIADARKVLKGEAKLPDLWLPQESRPSE